MTANVITYRGRSAAREIGKALNFPHDVLDRFSRSSPTAIFRTRSNCASRCEQAGLPHDHPRAPAFAALYQQMYGLPRHLGQHSGGMIICQGNSIPSCRWKMPRCPAASSRNGTRTIAKTSASSKSICSGSA